MQQPRGISERAYTVLLRLYPFSYLRQYREPLEQAFRDQHRAAGSPAQSLRITIAALIDLLLTASQLHLHERNETMKTLKLHVLALFAIMTLFLGRFELRTDDTGVMVFFILLFSFILAYLQPAWARLWAFVGICVPIAHIVIRPGLFVIQPHQTEQSWTSLAGISLVVLALGFAGSFLGARVRQTLARPVA